MVSSVSKVVNMTTLQAKSAHPPQLIHTHCFPIDTLSVFMYACELTAFLMLYRFFWSRVLYQIFFHNLFLWGRPD